MAHSEVNSGIYKITAPSGAVYIGQSKNIRKRFNKYRSLNCKNQRKLYNCLKKYKFKNCVVEIIHPINVDSPRGVYDFFEILFIGVYKFDGVNMLNIENGGNSIGKMSDETKQILSNHHKQHPNKTVFKKGHKHSKETLKRMSDIKKGKPSNNKGVKVSGESLERIRSANRAKIGKYQRGNSCHAKTVVDTKTGVIYASLLDASEAFNMKRSTLGSQLSGQNRNKTTLRWYKNVLY